MHNKQQCKSNVVDSNNNTTSNIKLFKNNSNISNIVLGSTIKQRLGLLIVSNNLMPNNYKNDGKNFRIQLR